MHRRLKEPLCCRQCSSAFVVVLTSERDERGRATQRTESRQLTQREAADETERAQVALRNQTGDVRPFSWDYSKRRRHTREERADEQTQPQSAAVRRVSHSCSIAPLPVPLLASTCLSFFSFSTDINAERPSSACLVFFSFCPSPVLLPLSLRCCCVPLWPNRLLRVNGRQCSAGQQRCVCSQPPRLFKCHSTTIVHRSSFVARRVLIARRSSFVARLLILCASH